MKDNHPFDIDAFVLLPEHLHCIWTLPDGDRDFSKRWRLIKGYFTRNCDARFKQNGLTSREHKGEQTVWQPRFWEHLIRNDDDFARHVEYIHYNPVKHGLAKAPKAWAYSSFHKYVREGKIDALWGAGGHLDFDEGIGME